MSDHQDVPPGTNGNSQSNGDLQHIIVTGFKRVRGHEKVRDESGEIISRPHSPVPVTLEKILYAFRDGRWAEIVDPIAARWAEVYHETKGDFKAAKKAIGALKRNLPAVAFNAELSARGDRNVIRLSGLNIVDIDDRGPEQAILDLETLKKSPHIVSAFRSPSWAGVKPLVHFRVPELLSGADVYHWFPWAASHVIEHIRSLGFEPDEKATKTLERMTFVGHDPLLWTNWDAIPLEIPPMPEAKKAPEGGAKEQEGPQERSQDPWVGDLPPEFPKTRMDAAREFCRANNIEFSGEIVTKQKISGPVCGCPNKQLHGNPDGKYDCIIRGITEPGAPLFLCQHDSCQAANAEVSHKLASYLGKIEFRARMEQEAAERRRAYARQKDNEPKFKGAPKPEEGPDTMREERPEPEEEESAGPEEEPKAEGPPPPEPPEPPEEVTKEEIIEWMPRLFRVTRKGEYWCQLRDRSWGMTNTEQIVRRLHEIGMPRGRANRHWIDRALQQIEIDNRVDVSLPVAGCPIGIWEMHNNLILVPTQASPIVPVNMPWPDIKLFLCRHMGSEALDDNGNPDLAARREALIQLEHLLGICQLAFKRNCWWFGMTPEELKTAQPPPWHMLMALLLFGKNDIGKSFLQYLLALILGGRIANPYDYLIGKANFNAELGGSENHVCGDPVTADHKGRKTQRVLASKIKEAITTPFFTIEGKYQTRICLPSRFWITMSFNLNAESLKFAPVHESDMADKLMSLRCYPAMPKDQKEAALFKARILAQLPGFAWYLMYEHVIREELSNERTGILPYQNPAIVEKIEALAPFNQLIADLDELVFGSTLMKDPVTGTAREIRQKLEEAVRTSGLPTEDREEILGRWNASAWVGRMLSELSLKEDRRVVQIGVSHKQALWRILPPTM